MTRNNNGFVLNSKLHNMRRTVFRFLTVFSFSSVARAQGPTGLPAFKIRFKVTGETSNPKDAQGTEAYYDFALTPAVRIIPSYQQIWNPLVAQERPHGCLSSSPHGGLVTSP